MTDHTPTTRVPLRLPGAVATFGIGIAGYLGVNLSPYMIAALQTALATDVLTASWIVTATLLATAITGLVVARLCAGPRRLAVARIGLVIAAAGFGVAAFVPVPAAVVAGLIAGGIGAGGAVASSGAALAAFINPERVAGVNGLANRAVITVILAVVPMIGLAPASVFGVLSLFSLAMLATTAWLPAAPILAPAGAVPTTATAEPGAHGAAAASVTAFSASSRRVTIAGLALLVCFALWAVSEDSLWAMAGVIGAEQAALTPEGLGIALSGATAGGILGAILITVVGDRFGRALPLAILLAAGGILKMVESTVTDPTAFIVVFIAWNTIYAVAFLYFVSTAAALDADGRWSGPLLAVYLVGSALTPVIGAALVEAFGFQGFGIVLGIASFALITPVVLVARFSREAQAAEATDAAASRLAPADAADAREVRA
ncbi:MFS transporter [Agromyces bracchium]|uniref:MFS transporter n=1 Tax=Agromyces bracchium TaxID=88376 RepID=A0A6I3LXH8_9MICO|nr:MFS transporter [Agromyces bracchium]MTH67260.1 MFS transporter [Agromyces bracchium]